MSPRGSEINLSRATGGIILAGSCTGQPEMKSLHGADLRSGAAYQKATKTKTSSITRRFIPIVSSLQFAFFIVLGHHHGVFRKPFWWPSDPVFFTFKDALPPRFSVVRAVFNLFKSFSK